MGKVKKKRARRGLERSWRASRGVRKRKHGRVGKGNRSTHPMQQSDGGSATTDTTDAAVVRVPPRGGTARVTPTAASSLSVAAATTTSVPSTAHANTSDSAVAGLRLLTILVNNK